MTMWKVVEKVFSCLTRTIGVSAGGRWVSVFTTALAIGVLLGADAIEDVLADRHPIWAQMVKPGAWASLMASVCVIAWLLWPRMCVALSPKFKLRSMAEDLDALARSLSNDENYDRNEQGGLGPPLLCLEIEIAALKGKLESISVHSPPSSEVEAWQNYLPMLRGWVAAGSLRTARSYQPGTTAIVGWRRFGVGS